jgi:hypothetical protein
MLYRLLYQKKKDSWNLTIPILGLVISLLIPYNLGDEFMEMIMGIFSKLGNFTMFLAFTGLILAVVSIVLYFVNKPEQGKEELK